MALLKTEVYECSNLSEEEDECSGVPLCESTKVEEEEYVCCPSHGDSEQDKEVDEEQQLMLEGSL